MERLLRDWRVAPLQAPESLLRQLPDCSIVSCALDNLAPSNALLAETLGRLGVSVERKHVECTPHGFLTFPRFGQDTPRIAATVRWLEERARAAVEAHAAKQQLPLPSVA